MDKPIAMSNISGMCTGLNLALQKYALFFLAGSNPLMG